MLLFPDPRLHRQTLLPTPVDSNKRGLEAKHERYHVMPTDEWGLPMFSSGSSLTTNKGCIEL